MADQEHKKFDAQTHNHPTSGKGYGCVWKHAAEISQTEWDSHPCHYPSRGVESLQDAPNKNRLHWDHRARGKRLGYLRERNGKWSVAMGPVKDVARDKAPDRKASRAARGKPFSLKGFLEEFGEVRSASPLEWLALEQDGWHVDHPHPNPGNDPKFKAVKTFQLKRGRTWHPGQSYPYLHEHHHIIPADALETFVLAPGGDSTKRDARIKVLLIGKWNLNHKNNMVVLPCEVVPARVVGLPAHCPWDEADHPKYTDSLETWLKDARKVIDSKLKEKKHAVIAQGGAKLDKVSRDLRDVIYQVRNHDRLAAVRGPKAGEA